MTRDNNNLEARIQLSFKIGWVNPEVNELEALKMSLRGMYRSGHNLTCKRSDLVGIFPVRKSYFCGYPHRSFPGTPGTPLRCATRGQEL